MRRRTIVTVVTLACALTAGAAASSAAAAGITGYTCVEAPLTIEAEFKDNHCTEAGMNASGSNYKHTAIAEDTSTEFVLSAVGNQKFEMEEFSSEVILEATEVECLGCTVKNQSSGTTMDVSSLGDRLLYKGMTTDFPHCAVSDPVKGVGKLTTEPLKFTATSLSGTKIEPVTGSVFADFDLVNSGGVCDIAGEYLIVGFATVKTRGATLSVNTVEGELSEFGEPVFLTGQTTMRGGESGLYHPYALTAT
jgi:hypothetical protein